MRSVRRSFGAQLGPVATALLLHDSDYSHWQSAIIPDRSRSRLLPVLIS